MKKLLLVLFLTLFSSLYLVPHIKAVGDPAICDGLTNPSAKQDCIACRNNDFGVWTGLGCITAGSPNLFILEILNWAVGLGGVIAFLLIIYASFQIVTASGDPKRVKAGQELLSSAIAGLILIVFSLVLLNFIGVEILHLPGFEGNPNI
jgi:hypothetical protein